MNLPKTDRGVTEALSFLTFRITEQAHSDSVPLTETELSQLSFSEETASSQEIAAAQEFDAENDRVEFEAKITKLLRRAYHHDVQCGMKDSWQEHLADLRDHDIYVLIMVDQARIPRRKPNVPKLLLSGLSPRKLLRLLTLPDAIAATLSFCGFVYFFLLPMRWGRNDSSSRIFGNLAEHLIPSESIRGALFVMWLGSIFWLSYAYRKRKL
jgi:hypothetical protein